MRVGTRRACSTCVAIAIGYVGNMEAASNELPSSLARLDGWRGGIYRGLTSATRVDHGTHHSTRGSQTPAPPAPPRGVAVRGVQSSSSVLKRGPGMAPRGPKTLRWLL